MSETDAGNEIPIKREVAVDNSLAKESVCNNHVGSKIPAREMLPKMTMPMLRLVRRGKQLLGDTGLSKGES